MDAHKLYMLSNTYGQQAVTHFLNDLVYSYRPGTCISNVVRTLINSGCSEGCTRDAA
jgi:hypothetical protein